MPKKSERLLKIYSRLKQSPVTIEIICNWATKNGINLSARTFYRDLTELENNVLPKGETLVATVGEKNKKTWKIEYDHGETRLDHFDITSYLLFKNFLALPVLTARQKSLDKIENLFYQTYSKSRFEELTTIASSQIRSSHFYEVEDSQEYEKLLDDCIWSIQNRRELEVAQVRLDHTSLGASRAFPVTVWPQQLIYHRGVVHLSGFAKDTGKLLILALPQIETYHLTNQPFAPDGLGERHTQELSKRFGISENIDDEVYPIEIEFSELTGSFVRSQHWHPTQQFEVLQNGNYLMRLRCGINRELAGWIFQWMSNAKVLQPPLLRQMVADKFCEVCEIYEQDKEIVSNNSFRA